VLFYELDHMSGRCDQKFLWKSNLTEAFFGTKRTWHFTESRIDMHSSSTFLTAITHLLPFPTTTIQVEPFTITSSPEVNLPLTYPHKALLILPQWPIRLCWVIQNLKTVETECSVLVEV